mmetsp:Transcript_26879/g.30098  ORF Transcript_26879/g.30098 Transcript_26879/m.30098 type:complete len:126 (-) Transcript_26879:1133-1510(-)
MTMLATKMHDITQLKNILLLYLLHPHPHQQETYLTCSKKHSISITEIKIEIDKNNTTCSVARVARLVYFQRKIKKMLYNNMQAEPNLLCGKILLLSRYRWEEHQCATTTTFQPRVQTAVDRPKGE